jgi:hypothetical protein
MQAYANLSGKSGVQAFEIRKDGIVVRFVGGGTYVYDRNIPGSAHVDAMKRLALAGRGLARYITGFGGAYARRLD